MKINHANPEVPNLVRIPLFRQHHHLPIETLSQRIGDIAFGSCGGDFDFNKTFYDQEIDYSSLLTFKYAVANATGIPMGKLPRLGNMTCNQFSDALYKLLYEREGTIVPGPRPVSQAVPEVAG